MDKEKIDNFIGKLKKFKKYVWIAMIIIVIYGAYNAGTMFGLMMGVSIAMKVENKTMCNFFIENTNTNKSYGFDDEGYCILSREAKYNMKTKCPHGNYTTQGGKELGKWLELTRIPQKIIYYPMTRCW